MNNVFYRPKLGKYIKGKRQESIIYRLGKSADTEKMIKSQDIIDLLMQFDEEMSECRKCIVREEEKILDYEKRKKRLLMNTAIQNALKSQLQIDDLDLSAKTYNKLCSSNVIKVWDLCNMTVEETMNITGIKKENLDEIIDKLDVYGLKLRDYKQENENSEPAIEELELELAQKLDELFGDT